MNPLSHIMSGGLTAAILSGLLVMGAEAANFQQVQTYTPGRFSDVASGKWYESSVKSVYELGLMNGNSATTFNPTGKFTLAEAATIASKLHAKCYDLTVISVEGAPWYQGAVDYCLQAHIIQPNQFTDYTRPATRAEMASILVSSMPDSSWAAINSVSALPDVTDQTPYQEAIFTFYNAGILSGADQYGTFNPNANITRAEVAAIVSRCARPEERLALNLQPAPTPVSPAPTDLVSALDSFAAKTGYLYGQLAGVGFFYDLDQDGTDEMALMGYRENMGDGLPGCVYSLYDNENGTLVVRVDQEPIAHAVDGSYITLGITMNSGRPQLTARALVEQSDLVHQSETYKFHAYKTAQLESVFEMRAINAGGWVEYETMTQNGVPIDYYEFERLTNCNFVVRCDFGSNYDKGELTLAQMREKLQRKTYTTHEIEQMTNAYMEANFNSDATSGGRYHVSAYDYTQNGMIGSFNVRYSRNNAPPFASANVLAGTFNIDLITMTGTIEWLDGSTHFIDLNKM